MVTTNNYIKEGYQRLGLLNAALAGLFTPLAVNYAIHNNLFVASVESAAVVANLYMACMAVKRA